MVRGSLCSTYLNQGKTIQRHIDSLLPQVTEAVEWVMVDAGSDDGTWRACADAAIRNPRVRAYQVKGPGVLPITRGEGRDIAARLSSGRVQIHALDGDVIYRDGAIALIYDQFKARGLDAMYGDSYSAVWRAVYEAVEGFPHIQVEEDFQFYRAVGESRHTIATWRSNCWKEDHNRFRPLRNLAPMGSEIDHTEPIL